MTLHGPDGAVYQDGIKLAPADWAAIDFGVWRAIHQNGTPDRTFTPMMREFRARLKPFAAYVWVDGMDPERKADYAAAAIADTSIPVMVDWEDPACPFDRMLTFVDAVRRRGYRVPLLYTGRSFWQTMGSPALAGHGLDLVVARYGDQTPTAMYECQDRYKAMERYSVWDWNLGGLQPVMWQFGSRVRWGDRYMDMNAIREPADLSRWFQAWAPPTPTPQPTGDDDVLPEDIEAIATRVLELAASDAIVGKQFRWAVGAAPWQTNLGDGPLNTSRPAGQILGSIRSDTSAISAAVRKLGPGATAEDFVKALAAELERLTMSTYTYKLLGALIGVVAGLAMVGIGAVTGDEALKIGGSSIASAAATAIYTNGRKGTEQP